MVGLQVDGPLGVVLGRSKGLCGWSWAAPRASVGGPGPLSGPLWAVLGRLGVFVGGPGPSWVRSWVLCWRSWAALGPLLPVLSRSWRRGVRSWAAPGTIWAVWSRSRGLCARSWVALGAYVGGLGPLLGPMWPKNGANPGRKHDRTAALDHFWGLWVVLCRTERLCCRSWAALGASVRGP